MREIRHIVFDIGRVLIHWEPELAYLELIPDRRQRQWFLANVTNSAWNVEQDRGREWPEAEALLIEAFPDHEHLIRAYRGNWTAMVPHAHVESVALLEELIDAGRDVTLLTNFASDTFAEAQRLYPFLKKPRGVTVSAHHGLIKPERAIYDLHARTFGLVPADTLFIDDSAANVEGARAAGWSAIHCTDPALLRRELIALGLDELAPVTG